MESLGFLEVSKLVSAGRGTLGRLQNYGWISSGTLYQLINEPQDPHVDDAIFSHEHMRFLRVGDMASTDMKLCSNSINLFTYVTFELW